MQESKPPVYLNNGTTAPRHHGTTAPWHHGTTAADTTTVPHTRAEAEEADTGRMQARKKEACTHRDRRAEA